MLANLTKAEAVYREARWRILTGALPPGRPVNQADLAAEFGVSPTPIREALRRLESEGLVIFTAHTMVAVAPLDLKELDDLYAIRAVLDPLAGQLAAAHRTPEDVARVTELLDRRATTEPRDRFERNRAFHRAVFSASGNQQLTHHLDQLWDRTERYRIVLVAHEVEAGGSARHERQRSDDDHRAIAAAVRSGDGEHASTLLRAHILRSHALIRGMLQGVRN
jgi:DNA-binding GntR family transcriptional regulator